MEVPEGALLVARYSHRTKGLHFPGLVWTVLSNDDLRREWMRYSASEARALNCRRVLTETQSYERRLTKNILKDIATVSPTLEGLVGTGLAAFASGPLLELWRGARMETGNPDWDLSKLGPKLNQFRRRKGASD